MKWVGIALSCAGGFMLGQVAAPHNLENTLLIAASVILLSVGGVLWGRYGPKT